MARKPKLGTTSSIKLPPFSASQADDLWVKNPAVIKNFLEARPEFEKLCIEVEYILKKKIATESIETSFVGSRAKTLNSFIEKLGRKGYTDPFNQIDDLAGVRIVCLYSSHIPKVIEIVRREFEVIEEIDKRETLDTNEFGYIGHHLIVKLGRNYSGARYDDLRSLRCEVQIRTVVQDAWTIIQHHMVYKKESQVPSNLIRKLNGLAGLFETADDQFEYIRIQRDAYLETVRESKSAPNHFLENEINYDSIVEFLKWKYKEFPIDEYQEVLSKILDLLNHLNLPKLKDLETEINNHEKFSKYAIKRYCELNSSKHEEPCLEALEEKIESPIKLAVALSAIPEWRAFFPWGGYWPTSFEYADESCKTEDSSVP